jgi:glutathione S-transferase
MITLYHSSRARSARILWLLEELGIPYEVKEIAFTPDSLKSPEYLAIHPLGKVPAVRDGELTIFESGAIVEYLVERYGNGRLAPPLGSPLRAPYLQWLHFAEATALPPLSDLAQHTMFKPEEERIAAVAADARQRVVQVVEVLEQAIQGRRYFAGDEFTAADVMMGYSLTLMKWFGLIGAEQPNLSAYLTRIEQRPAYQKGLS